MLSSINTIPFILYGTDEYKLVMQLLYFKHTISGFNQDMLLLGESYCYALEKPSTQSDLQVNGIPVSLLEIQTLRTYPSSTESASPF